MGPGLQADANASLTRRAIETRERILDAAESVFARCGFDAATTREIAALSETNVATTYSYFATKEALYAAVGQDTDAILTELGLASRIAELRATGVVA